MSAKGDRPQVPPPDDAGAQMTVKAMRELMVGGKVTDVRFVEEHAMVVDVAGGVQLQVAAYVPAGALGPEPSAGELRAALRYTVPMHATIMKDTQPTTAMSIEWAIDRVRDPAGLDRETAVRIAQALADELSPR